MKFSIIFCILFLAGCTTSSSKGVIIDANIKDDVKNQKFLISFTNNYGYQLCLSPGMWPNSAGKLDFARDRVFVLVAGETYPLLDFNTGYCPECTLRVLPGESIEGFIKYTDFSLPKKLYKSEKHLSFSPVATICKGSRMPSH